MACVLSLLTHHVGRVKPGLSGGVDALNFAVDDETLLYHTGDSLADGDTIEVIATISGG